MTTTKTDAPELRGSILGTRVRRTEDLGFLTTGAVYTEDLVDDRLTGALRATFVRSPIAHATIAAIDTAEALTAPGVVAVLTADDLAGTPTQKPSFPMFPEAMAQPLLARDVVRFVGEPVAVVLTDDRYAGEDAAEMVAVDYDPLPVVADMKSAVADDTLLFPDHGSNVVMKKDPGLRRGHVRRLRGRRLPRDRQPAGGGRPARGALGRGGLGRGRPAHALAAEPGRPGIADRGRRHARPRRGECPHHHARRGWSVRGEVRRRRRARRGRVRRPQPRPSGHLGGDPVGEHGRDDARPGADPDGDPRRPA